MALLFVLRNHRCLIKQNSSPVIIFPIVLFWMLVGVNPCLCTSSYNNKYWRTGAKKLKKQFKLLHRNLYYEVYGVEPNPATNSVCSSQFFLDFALLLVSVACECYVSPTQFYRMSVADENLSALKVGKNYSPWIGAAGDGYTLWENMHLFLLLLLHIWSSHTIVLQRVLCPSKMRSNIN